MSQPLRMLRYQDPETGKELTFVTNAGHLDARTIADLYKERWQIELFFQMDQGQPQDQNVSGNIAQCGADANLDCPERVSVPCLFEIQGQTVPVPAANAALAAAQSL